MIFVDANILLYAEDSLSRNHKKAKQWWDAQLSGTNSVCLCWTVINAFIRIGTNARIFERPLSLHEAISRVQSWLEQPCTRVVVPTERHWDIFRKLLEKGQATANLVYRFNELYLFTKGSAMLAAWPDNRLAPN